MTNSAPASTLHPASLGLAVAALGVRGIGAFSTPAAAVVADAVFCRTTRHPPRSDEAAFLARAEPGSLRVLKHRIQCWRWPGDGPRLLLAHGWCSQPGRFAALASAAQAAGAELVAFDAPGHGRSNGWRTSMPEVARTLRVVADAYGPIDAIIGHSLGGAAALYALQQGLKTDRVVTIAAPANVGIWLDRFRTTLSLSEAIDQALRARLAARLHVTLEELDLRRSIDRITARGLVIHDEDDTDVPVQAAINLAEAWPGAVLHTTNGLGHRAILRDAEVIRRVVEFTCGTPGASR